MRLDPAATVFVMFACGLGGLVGGANASPFEPMPEPILLDGLLDAENAPIAMDENFIVIANPVTEEVFVLDLETGSLLWTLTQEDPGLAVRDWGAELEIDDGIIVVGSNASGFGDVGIVEVFDAATGQRLHTLQANATADDRFGQSVDIDSGIIAVGADLEDFTAFPAPCGVVYLYDAQTGGLILEIGAADTSMPQIFFGADVALGDGVLAVNANNELLFTFDAATGAEIGAALATPTSGNYRSGSLAVESGMLFIADSDAAAPGSGTGSGAVAIFDPNGLNLIDVFSPSPYASGGNIGHRLRAAPGGLVVGGPGIDSGRGEVFAIDPGEATTKRLFLAPNESGENPSRFGEDVAVNAQGDVLVMAIGADVPAGNPWLYLYRGLLASNDAPCLGDANGDGVVDLADLNAVLAAFGQLCP